MALVSITRKTVTLQGFQLTSPADMVTALNYLAGGNYTGSINCQRPSGTVIWELWIQQSNGTGGSQKAGINDWIVIENNSIAKTVSAADFANLYTQP